MATFYGWVQPSQNNTATTRRQFTFYHSHFTFYFTCPFTFYFLPYFLQFTFYPFFLFTYLTIFPLLFSVTERPSKTRED